MKANKKSLYQEGGSVAKDSVNPVVSELSGVIKNNIENGGSPEEILKTFLLQGIPVDQLTLAFESIGYDPGAFGELLQNVEVMMAQEEQAQQQEQPAQEQAPMEPSMMQPQNQEQPEMQYGGSNVSSGILSRSPQDKRPIYMPPVPAKGNVLGAAFLLDDFVGKTFSKEDKNGDGLMDGSFRDSKAKRARFKSSQNALNKYDVDFGTNNPADYVINYDDLASGNLRTKEQYEEDILHNSLVTGFNPEKQEYSGAILSNISDYDKLGKNQKKELGVLGDKKEGIPGFFGFREDPTINPDNRLSSFMNRVEALDPIQKEMMLEQLRGRDEKTKGTGLNMDFQQYADKDKTPEELELLRAQYATLMMGAPMNSAADRMASIFPSASNETFGESTERSVVQLPPQDPTPPMAREPYKEWAQKNQKRLQLRGLTTEAQQRAVYDAESEFKYGGDYLPLAQYGIPGSGMGAINFEDIMQSQMQTDLAADTQAVADSQLQKDNPGLGNTPLQNQQAIQGSGPGSGMGSMFLDQQALQKELDGLMPDKGTTGTDDSTTAAPPTVKKNNSLGNVYSKAENFIKNNPAMRKFGDISEGAVLGANLVNEIFQQKEFNNYRNELRNSTVADNVYLASENPVNKRGTFDANSGLAEPDNLVDYYAQAMYGKETYKAGGEFEPHMMYDPVSGKGYKANVESDHNRYAKLGFLHKDEMEKGGEIEIDNDTLAALIAAGADIEIL